MMRRWRDVMVGAVIEQRVDADVSCACEDKRGGGGGRSMVKGEEGGGGRREGGSGGRDGR